MIPNAITKKLLDGEIDLLSDQIYVALLNDTHSSNPSTQEFFASVNANEVSASGYTTGGKALSSKATTVDASNSRGEFTANPTVWSIVGTLTARYAVIYKNTGDPNSSPILRIVDFGSNRTASDNDFTLNWNSEGIIQVRK